MAMKPRNEVYNKPRRKAPLLTSADKADVEAGWMYFHHRRGLPVPDGTVQYGSQKRARS